MTSPSDRLAERQTLAFKVKWTRDFIRDFGLGEYWRVVIRDANIYRLRNWRCWFGHVLREPHWEYADYSYLRFDGWRYCQRSACEYCERAE